MNISVETIKETKETTITERESRKIKELSNAPKELDAKIKEADIAKLKDADNIASERLNNQKEATTRQDTTKKNEVVESLPFKHTLNPGLNKSKGKEISYGGTCAELCRKTKTPVGAYG